MTASIRALSIQLLLSIGCARATPEAAAPPPAPPPTSVVTAPPPRAPDCSESLEACYERGRAALESGDPSARALLEHACGSGLEPERIRALPAGERDSWRTVRVILEACVAYGRALATGKGGPRDVAGARVAFAKSCQRFVSVDGCAWLVKITDKDAVDVRTARDGCHSATPVSQLDPDDRAARAEACLVFAQKTRDEREVSHAHAVACELGVAESCRARDARAMEAPPPVATPAPSDVAGASLRVDKMNIDGVTLSAIACKADGIGGLIGGALVGAGFKGRKAKLDACAPTGPTETRVKWIGAGGRMTNVRASGSDAGVSRCVERALAGAPATTSGECAATVAHGRK